MKKNQTLSVTYFVIDKLMYRYHKNYSRNSVYEQANAQTFEKFQKHEKLTQTKFK